MNYNKVRIYDLAKELKQDTKRVMEELRREGADVGVPSNSVSKEIADKVRSKYFPKKEPTSNSQTIKIIKRTPTTKRRPNNSETRTKTESRLNLPLNIKENKFEEIINSQKERLNNNFIAELKVDCRECLRPTKHNLIHSINMTGTECKDEYQIVQCMGCESFSFRRITFKTNQSNHKEEIDLYPSRIKGRQKLQLESVPPTIARIYEEIHLAISNRLLIVATIGMRTLIELVCNDLNSTAGNLKGKIDDLVRKQLLTPKDANNLHKLRDFGNAAAHEASIQSENTLNKCIDIIEHLLKGIYSSEITN